MRSFKAIIFDCDGVLIDSEVLSCSNFAQFVSQHGYPLSTEECLDRFMGKSGKDAFKEIKNETGIEMEKYVNPEKQNSDLKKIFEEKLKSIPYVKEILEKLKLPYCIASGSSMERLGFSLEITELDKYFESKVFSAELVEKGKPAPDIFLYAAEKLGVGPKDCLVIEDGHHGTKAGVAAGMTVYGFTGGSHMTPERIQMLKDSGAEKLFDDMRDLLKWI